MIATRMPMRNPDLAAGEGSRLVVLSFERQCRKRGSLLRAERGSPPWLHAVSSPQRLSSNGFVAPQGKAAQRLDKRGDRRYNGHDGVSLCGRMSRVEGESRLWSI